MVGNFFGFALVRILDLGDSYMVAGGSRRYDTHNNTGHKKAEDELGKAFPNDADSHRPSPFAFFPERDRYNRENKSPDSNPYIPADYFHQGESMDRGVTVAGGDFRNHGKPGGVGILRGADPGPASPGEITYQGESAVTTPLSGIMTLQRKASVKIMTMAHIETSPIPMAI